MAIDFTRTTFGAPKQAAANNETKAKGPPAQFWLNIGYEVPYQGKEGMETRFLSLPMGIPLDTQDHVPTNSRDEQYAAFQAGRNSLLDQIKEAAQKLRPGQEVILNLQIQLRRVNEESAAVSPETNQFIKPLQLVA